MEGSGTSLCETCLPIVPSLYNSRYGNDTGGLGPQINPNISKQENIAELIIYIVKGDDVRHVPLAKIESTLNNGA